MTPAAIKELAVRYRELIGKSDRSQWGASFEDFPHALLWLRCSALTFLSGAALTPNTFQPFTAMATIHTQAMRG